MRQKILENANLLLSKLNQQVELDEVTSRLTAQITVKREDKVRILSSFLAGQIDANEAWRQLTVKDQLSSADKLMLANKLLAQHGLPPL